MWSDLLKDLADQWQSREHKSQPWFWKFPLQGGLLQFWEGGWGGSSTKASDPSRAKTPLNVEMPYFLKH